MNPRAASFHPNAASFDPDAASFGRSTSGPAPIAGRLSNGLADQIALLEQIFPEFRSDSLLAFLEAHQYDLMLCVERLLAKDTDQSPPSDATSATDPSGPSPSSIVCKYFLNGHCLIDNCQFLHSRTDRSAICRYFLRGFCSRGDDCSFLHELQSVTTTATAVPVPTVVRAPAPPQAQPSQVVFDAPFDLAARMKLEQVQRSWPHVNPQMIEEIFRSSGNTISGCESQLRNRFGAPVFNLSRPVAAPVKRPPSTPLWKNRQQTKPAGSVPIVSSGDAVSALYLQKREEAQEHARRRNLFFTRATAAFLSGDGALAKEMSQKGRYHQVQMESLHAIASGTIFEDRNRNLQGHVIDVHGLHANEAIDKIHRLIAQLRSSSFSSHTFVDVITGIGKHSYDGVAKVRPAVIEYLRQSKTPFREMGVAGSIRINI